jgi:hypothetical protein
MNIRSGSTLPIRQAVRERPVFAHWGRALRRPRTPTHPMRRGFWPARGGRELTSAASCAAMPFIASRSLAVASSENPLQAPRSGAGTAVSGSPGKSGLTAPPSAGGNVKACACVVARCEMDRGEPISPAARAAPIARPGSRYGPHSTLGRARCSWRSALVVKPKPNLHRQRNCRPHFRADLVRVSGRCNATTTLRDRSAAQLHPVRRPGFAAKPHGLASDAGSPGHVLRLWRVLGLHRHRIGNEDHHRSQRRAG